MSLGIQTANEVAIVIDIVIRMHMIGSTTHMKEIVAYGKGNSQERVVGIGPAQNLPRADEEVILAASSQALRDAFHSVEANMFVSFFSFNKTQTTTNADERTRVNLSLLLQAQVELIVRLQPGMIDETNGTV